MLSDSDGSLQPADYARLDHPASFTTGSGTQYYEYMAGTYLSIQLGKQAHVNAIAIQGSPHDLRYYLKSFELWYKTTLYNMNVNLPSTTISGYYKENDIVRVRHVSICFFCHFVLWFFVTICQPLSVIIVLFFE